MTPDPIDQDLIIAKGLRAGDPRALEQLYDCYARRAFGLAFRLVGNGAAAEDIVQEAFLAVWKNAARIDPGRGSLAALLLTVVHNKAIDHLRRDRAQRTVPLRPTDPDDRPDPAEQALRTLDRDSVRSALTRLPREQRQAVSLAYFGGYSHSELARATKIGRASCRERV